MKSSKERLLRKGLLLLFILLLASFASGASYVKFLADGFFQGDLEVTGSVSASEYCIGESCIQSWPSGSGSSLRTDCASGEILKWDGSNWACGTDNSGSSSGSGDGSVLEWVEFEVDASISGAYTDSYGGSQTFTSGYSQLYSNLPYQYTQFGVTKLSPDDYCKSEGYDSATAACLTTDQGREAHGFLMSNNHIQEDSSLYAYACQFGETVFLTPTHLQCFKGGSGSSSTSGSTSLPSCSTNQIIKFNATGSGDWVCVDEPSLDCTTRTNSGIGRGIISVSATCNTDEQLTGVSCEGDDTERLNRIYEDGKYGVRCTTRNGVSEDVSVSATVFCCNMR